MINPWPDCKPKPNARRPTTAFDTNADLEPGEMLSMLMAVIGQERNQGWLNLDLPNLLLRPPILGTKLRPSGIGMQIAESGIEYQ